MNYRIVRQRRRTIGLTVQADGVLEVRAPLTCPLHSIEQCIREHGDWIAQRQRDAQGARDAQAQPPRTLPLLGRELPVRPGTAVRLAPGGDAILAPAGAPLGALMPALAALYRAQAEQFLPGRVAFWAARFGLKPARVRVTGAAGRWGSCSAKGALCFSWRLMLASPAAVDSVVIHELMHLVELNHSPAFRRLERENTPALDACKQELEALAARLTREGWR